MCETPKDANPKVPPDSDFELSAVAVPIHSSPSSARPPSGHPRAQCGPHPVVWRPPSGHPRSQPKPQKPAATDDTSKEPIEKSSVPPPKKRIDINEPRICKNKGCGKSYKEKDNHDSACDYHPGPAVFHDRMRGWKCCDVHVKEFDEFMEIPPCTKGWHNADAV
ncbi:unnamed protein product [Miscanthus lutarioriparius]|uniref:CHORD domain-containing protein n=1 Tax=Miscanthus lutarioriparius TaxID=422564 RepID=A0A811PSF5_9POAL|nr:unnamed protein product [Miscanthus lutarioriparius]